MNQYKPEGFTLPKELPFSQKTLENHLKLYEGYVKNTNLILEKIEEYAKDSEAHAYALGELQRRFAFEFDGMRNHEYYFRALEGGPALLPEDSPLYQEIEKTFGSFDAFFARFKAVAMTRGVGWAMLYYDHAADRLLLQWVDEQHLGHLTGLSPVIALDMWEHAYLMDHTSADKGKYAESYLSMLNWNQVNDWYVHARV
ncbi:MAG: superoxide dismutase [Mn] [Candidatus Campbellbacteria bacterium]